MKRRKIFLRTIPIANYFIFVTILVVLNKFMALVSYSRFESEFISTIILWTAIMSLITLVYKVYVPLEGEQMHTGCSYNSCYKALWPTMQFHYFNLLHWNNARHRTLAQALPTVTVLCVSVGLVPHVPQTASLLNAGRSGNWRSHNSLLSCERLSNVSIPVTCRTKKRQLKFHQNPTVTPTWLYTLICDDFVSKRL